MSEGYVTGTGGTPPTGHIEYAPSVQSGSYTAADVREFVGCMKANRCYACGWPIGPDASNCHPFDCSFRSDDPTYSATRERARKQATMLQAIRAIAIKDQS